MSQPSNRQITRINELSGLARAAWFCGRERRHETGTPLPPDAPRPPGHPLDQR